MAMGWDVRRNTLFERLCVFICSFPCVPPGAVRHRNYSLTVGEFGRNCPPTPHCAQRLVSVSPCVLAQQAGAEDAPRTPLRQGLHALGTPRVSGRTDLAVLWLVPTPLRAVT